MTSRLKGTFPPPLVFSGFLGLGLALHWSIPIDITYKYQWIRIPIGVHFILVAGAIAMQAFLIMRKNNTPVDFNRQTAVIVTKGPFRFTRNPLYLSMLLLFFSISVLVNSIWFLPCLLCMFISLRWTIRKEEAYLEGKFGDEYRRYKNNVRRWI